MKPQLVGSSARVEIRLVSADMDTPQLIRAGVPLPWNKCWCIGETIAKGTLRHTNSGCALASGSVDPMDAISCLQRMLPQLLDFLPAVTALRSRLRVECEVKIALYLMPEVRPPLYLSASIIDQLSALSASFDVDLYVLPG